MADSQSESTEMVGTLPTEMAVHHLVFVLVLPLLEVECDYLGFPTNEYEYSTKRDLLREEERRFGGESLQLSKVGTTLLRL